jgi:hypothetical protein
VWRYGYSVWDSGSGGGKISWLRNRDVMFRCSYVGRGRGNNSSRPRGGMDEGMDKGNAMTAMEERTRTDYGWAREAEINKVGR